MSTTEATDRERLADAVLESLRAQYAARGYFVAERHDIREQVIAIVDRIIEQRDAR